MTDLREQFATELGHTYRIESELGGAGMSRVFVAEELALGRKVVIKVLAPRLAAEMSLERFTREIKFAAGLQEPHIVPVLAAGTVAATPGGVRLPYYTMPFVAGESLRQRLRRTPRVPVPEALDILRGILSALIAAHEAGIVHRDIKPENVLLNRNGVPMVTDFGIAKAISAAHATPEDNAGAGGAELTFGGTVIGTPSYMAPEQFLSQPLDHRADLYAWGMIAYEMLAGAHPFSGKKDQSELIKAQIFEIPKPLENADAPAALVAMVEKCLAKEPADRPASASAILAALKDPAQLAAPRAAPALPRIVEPGPRWKRRGGFAIGFIAIAAVAIVAVLRVRGDQRVDAGDGSLARIAIAPFANRTGDSTLAPLGAMASDWITRGLTETGLLEVIPIAGAATSDAGTLRAAALSAGASTLLDGDIYMAGDSVRFVPTLLEAGSGRVIASVDPVSVPRGDPVAGLEVLRTRVAGVLAARIDPQFDADQLLGDPPSFEVYRLLLDARTEASVGRLTAATALLRRAAATDTAYLAPVLEELTILQDERNPPRADSLLRELNARRDRLTDYQAADLDQLQASLRLDLVGAYDAARRRAALAPKSATLKNSVAWAALAVNRVPEAMAIYASIDTTRLPGLTETYWSGRAYALHRLGRFQEELSIVDAGLARLPDNPRLQAAHVRALAGLNRANELRDLLSERISNPESAGDAVLFSAAFAERLVHGDSSWRENALGLLQWYSAAPPEMRTSRVMGNLPVVRLVIPTLTLLGRNAEAAALSDSMVGVVKGQLVPGVSRDFPIGVLGGRGIVAARQGDTATADAIIKRLRDLRETDLARPTSLVARAAISAQLGRRDDAVAALREAIASGASFRAVSPSSNLVINATISAESVWWMPLSNFAPFNELIRSAQ
jgi:tetratricopeptide (TPR) repeat protein/tRNA A-37 threonylcarbamoyl transferase component Bud32/TolB-like protein